jgi:F-type H+-transporting ATPase subunit alpha
MIVLKQNQYSPLPVEQQILFLYAVQNRFLETAPVDELKTLLKSYVSFIESKHPSIIEDIKVKKKFQDKTLELLKKITASFFEKRM